MLSVEPNIVFIDDKEEEVKGIIESYRNEGYGVKFFNADIATGDRKPNSFYSDVNLIFLDLYYDVNFDVELCTGWVEKIILENSFYVLVIWSKDTQHEKEIIEDLSKINRKPYIVISKQKGEDYKDENNEWNFQKLYDEISIELNKNSELEELATWKTSVKQASNIVIGHLAKDNTQENVIRRLQKIIIGHGGTHFISQNNHSEKQEILFDALDNVLISNSKNTRSGSEIAEGNKINLYSTHNIPNIGVDPILNSWFHFKLITEPLIQNNIVPGVICESKEKETVEAYRLSDDENILEYLSHQITESKKEGSKTKIVDISVLISRPCDIAQDKFGKNLKLLSGIKIVNPIHKSDLRRSFKTGNKYDSIKLYDHLYFSEEEEDVALIFDFRYVFSIPKQVFIADFKKVKVFNKELLSELQVEYSSYSSRLGITQVF